MDPHSRIYYVDHNTRTTAWERPQPLPAGLVELCLHFVVINNHFAPTMTERKSKSLGAN